MAISYEKTNWFNGRGPAINADNLNKIETGIKNATDEVNGIAAYTPAGEEAPLAGISLHGTNYKIAAGLPDGTAPGQAMIYNGTEWQKQEGYGYETPNNVMSSQTLTFEVSGGSTAAIKWFCADVEGLAELRELLSEEHVGEKCIINLDGVIKESRVFYDEENENYNLGDKWVENPSSAGLINICIDDDYVSFWYTSTSSETEIQKNVSVTHLEVSTINPDFISSDGGFGYTDENVVIQPEETIDLTESAATAHKSSKPHHTHKKHNAVPNSIKIDLNAANKLMALKEYLTDANDGSKLNIVANGVEYEASVYASGYGYYRIWVDAADGFSIEKDNNSSSYYLYVYDESLTLFTISITGQVTHLINSKYLTNKQDKLTDSYGISMYQDNNDANKIWIEAAVNFPSHIEGGMLADFGESSQYAEIEMLDITHDETIYDEVTTISGFEKSGNDVEKYLEDSELPNLRAALKPENAGSFVTISLDGDEYNCTILNSGSYMWIEDSNSTVYFDTSIEDPEYGLYAYIYNTSNTSFNLGSEITIKHAKIKPEYIPGDLLPEATTAGTAAVYDGEKWTAQEGYGYTKPAIGTVLTWEGDIAGRDSFTATGLGSGYKVSNILPSNEKLLSATTITGEGTPRNITSVITVTQYAQSQEMQVMEGDGDKARLALYNSNPVAIIVDEAQTIKIGNGTTVYVTVTFPSTGTYMCYEDAESYWKTIKYDCVNIDWDGDTTGKTPIILTGSIPMYKVSDDFAATLDDAKEITATYYYKQDGTEGTATISANSSWAQFVTLSTILNFMGYTVISGDPTKVLVLTNEEVFIMFASAAQTIEIQKSGEPVESYTFEAGTYFDKLVDDETSLVTYAINVNYGTNAKLYSIDSKYLTTKQDVLVSGANIKTINNQSILGSGNIEIQGGGLPAGTEASQALIWNGTEWTKQAGYGYETMATIASDLTVTFTDSRATTTTNAEIIQFLNDPTNLGKSAVVTYEGIEYNCIVSAFRTDALYIGNGSLRKGSIEDTGEPFVFFNYVPSTEVEVILAESETIAAHIFTLKAISINTINNKFIENGDILANSAKNAGLGYGGVLSADHDRDESRPHVQLSQGGTAIEDAVLYKISDEYMSLDAATKLSNGEVNWSSAWGGVITLTIENGSNFIKQVINNEEEVKGVAAIRNTTADNGSMASDAWFIMHTDTRPDFSSFRYIAVMVKTPNATLDLEDLGLDNMSFPSIGLWSIAYPLNIPSENGSITAVSNWKFVDPNEVHQIDSVYIPEQEIETPVINVTSGQVTTLTDSYVIEFTSEQQEILDDTSINLIKINLFSNGEMLAIRQAVAADILQDSQSRFVLLSVLSNTGRAAYYNLVYTDSTANTQSAGKGTLTIQSDVRVSTMFGESMDSGRGVTSVYGDWETNTGYGYEAPVQAQSTFTLSGWTAATSGYQTDITYACPNIANYLVPANVGARFKFSWYSNVGTEVNFFKETALTLDDDQNVCATVTYNSNTFGFKRVGNTTYAISSVDYTGGANAFISAVTYTTHQFASRYIPADATKQDKLTAGTGIIIDENNVISSTGGGGLPAGTEASQALIWNGTEWSKQAGYGYSKTAILDTSETIEVPAVKEKNSKDANRKWVNLNTNNNLPNLKAFLVDANVGKTVIVKFNDIDYTTTVLAYEVGDIYISSSAFEINEYDNGNTYELVINDESLTSVTISTSFIENYKIDHKFISDDGYGYINNNSRKEFSIEWDGNTQGKPSFMETYFKVSDLILTGDDIIGSIGTAAIGERSMSLVADVNNTIITEHGGYCTYDGTPVVLFSDGSLVLHEETVLAGVWFIKYGEFAVMTNLTSIHKIDSKYIPDAEPELPITATAGTAAIYNGDEWTAQDGYGYTETFESTDIEWNGDPTGLSHFDLDHGGLGIKFYKVDDTTFSDISVLTDTWVTGTAHVDGSTMSHQPAFSTFSKNTLAEVLQNHGYTITSGDASAIQVYYRRDSEWAISWFLTFSSVTQTITATYPGVADPITLNVVPGVYFGSVDLSSSDYAYVSKFTYTAPDLVHPIDSKYLTAKQDVLISGTNIKTINNESILGSGNITISGGEPASYIKDASASGNTLTLTKKDDSTVTFNNTTYSPGTNVTISADNKISATDTKYTQGSGITISGTTISADTSVVQPKLVSGTNIKTINSSSILSSGNITAVTSLGGSWGDISLDTTRLELVESSGGQLDVLTTVFPVGTSTGRTISEAGTTTLENIGIASGGCYVIRLIPENNTSMTDGSYPHTFMIDIVPGAIVNQYSTSTPEKPNAVWTSSLTLDVKFATANNFKTATIALEYHKLSTAGGSASITFSNVSAYAVKVTKLSD